MIVRMKAMFDLSECVPAACAHEARRSGLADISGVFAWAQRPNAQCSGVQRLLLLRHRCGTCGVMAVAKKVVRDDGDADICDVRDSLLGMAGVWPMSSGCPESSYGIGTMDGWQGTKSAEPKIVEVPPVIAGRGRSTTSASAGRVANVRENVTCERSDAVHARPPAKFIP